MDNLKVLLFEDNPGDAGLIEEMFEESEDSFELIHVETLKEGLEILNDTYFDILLIDLGLPDSDGIHTFFQIHEKFPKIPIVILTGLSDEAVALTAIQEGAQDYLSKKDLNSKFLNRSIKYSIERKTKEEQIKNSLKEKEIMLREIHHRVKNNLQIISSLLHLQEISTDIEPVVNELKETQGRVKTMAMVHEKLYQSPNLSDINFKEFLEKLVYDILFTYGIPKGTIEINLNIENINLNTETAIPLGLIVNELITNSVKYAFPESKGKITIKLKFLNEEMELIMADDGKGLPIDVNPKNTKTLGLQLVNNLTNQIDGHIEIDRSHGTKFTIIFKELEYIQRF